MVIDDIRIGPATVVQARERNPQLLLFLDDVEDSAGCQRPLVDAVERADGSGVDREVRAQNGLLGAERDGGEEGGDEPSGAQQGKQTEDIHGW